MQKPYYTQECAAKSLTGQDRIALAVDALSAQQTITELADERNVSRKFVYQQQSKASQAMNDVFNPGENDEKVLFYLPVTSSWLCQFILCLLLHCRGNYRGITKVLSDAFDHDMSIGNIHNIVSRAKDKAEKVNSSQNMGRIKLAAEDEVFHHRKPILSGVDIPSLFCFSLSLEEERDFETWGINLLDLKDKGFEPERVFGDDASAIEAAHQYVYPDTPYDLDHYHIISKLMDMRRFFRNRLKTCIRSVKALQKKVGNGLLTKNNESYNEQLAAAIDERQSIFDLSGKIDTLVGWMQHDVLNMPGTAPNDRESLFDFIVDELDGLAKTHPHRIESVVTTLRNQKPALLAFTDVLNEKFKLIADEMIYPVDKIWEMCNLQRCKIGGDRYAIRSIELQDYFGVDFDDIEDAVLEALESTERTSSMVENLHSRLRPYLNSRQTVDQGYLDLVRFYFNHVPFDARAKYNRRHKSPTEILTGQQHSHWLEMLGYTRFKKAA